MDRCVATRAPARAVLEKPGVINVADIKMPRAARARSLHLRVATQTKISVARHEHFGIDRAVRIMTDGAAFAQRRMLEYKRSRLRLVTLGAILVLPGNREAARGFHNVLAVRIVALDAVHFSFNDRVMLRKVKFGAKLEMALKASLRILARIDYEFLKPASAAHRDMFASRAVAGLAPALPRHLIVVGVQSRMRARRKSAHDIRMTVLAGFVSNEGRPVNSQRSNRSNVNSRAGIDKQRGAHGACAKRNRRQPADTTWPYFPHEMEGRSSCILMLRSEKPPFCSQKSAGHSALRKSELPASGRICLAARKRRVIG
jgi:hypothetical protein